MQWLFYASSGLPHTLTSPRHSERGKGVAWPGEKPDAAQVQQFEPDYSTKRDYLV